jgi:40-residue YVTN family beta-propeller repeat
MAPAIRVTATIPVGSGPEGIDVNPATNRIYVANQWQYTVSVIDGYAGSVVDTITLANTNNQGVGVNPATNRIYVSSFYNGRVNVIDGYSDTVIANLGVGSGPWGVGVNTNTSRVYVGNSNSNSVSVIFDPFTITATAGPGGSIDPSGQVGVNPGADQVFSITPDTGYHIDQVFVDGAYQGAPTSHTFSDVYADHTISAHFAVNTYTI